MGLLEMPHTMVGSLVIIFLVVFITINLLSETNRTQLEIATAKQDLEVIHISYMIEQCFKQDKEYVDKTFVSSADNICYSCGLCNPNVQTKLTDLKTQEEWNFDYEGKKDHQHTIFVNIQDGNQINPGRLNVEI